MSYFWKSNARNIPNQKPFTLVGTSNLDFRTKMA